MLRKSLLWILICPLTTQKRYLYIQWMAQIHHAWNLVVQCIAFSCFLHQLFHNNKCNHWPPRFSSQIREIIFIHTCSHPHISIFNKAHRTFNYKVHLSSSHFSSFVSSSSIQYHLYFPAMEWPRNKFTVPTFLNTLPVFTQQPKFDFVKIGIIIHF